MELRIKKVGIQHLVALSRVQIKYNIHIMIQVFGHSVTSFYVYAPVISVCLKWFSCHRSVYESH